jgi:hypothetical protein
MFWSFERDPLSIETEGIREWRAIFTLIVFVLTSKSSCVGTPASYLASDIFPL